MYTAQTFWDFLKRVLNVFLRKVPGPWPCRHSATVYKRSYQTSYIQYKGYIPDLTNDILFDTIWGFWGFFVILRNTFYIKGLSNMSNLYVFAGPSSATLRQQGSNQINPHHHLVIPLVHLVIHTLILNLILMMTIID